MCHLAKFCADLSNVPEMCPFSIFQDGGRLPSWIFKNSKITADTVLRANIRHCAKFRVHGVHRSNHSGDMVDF